MRHPCGIHYHDHQTEKTIEYSIVFSVIRQVWRHRMGSIMCAMLLAMTIWQNSIAVLLSSEAARQNALQCFAII